MKHFVNQFNHKQHKMMHKIVLEIGTMSHQLGLGTGNGMDSQIFYLKMIQIVPFTFTFVQVYSIAI